MSASTALVAHLRADAGVSPLVGDRIYATERPQAGPLPAIVYDHQLAETSYSMQGDSQYDVHEFELTAWAATKLEAESVRDAVRASLSGFKGTLGGGGHTITAGAVFVGNAGTDEFDDEPRVWGKSMTIEIHQEG